MDCFGAGRESSESVLLAREKRFQRGFGSYALAGFELASLLKCLLCPEGGPALRTSAVTSASSEM